MDPAWTGGRGRTEGSGGSIITSVRPAILSIGLFLLACAQPRADAPKAPVTVFAAASLARPLKQLTDSFQRRTQIVARAELGGSMEQSRKITELGRVPDVLMLVDDETIAALMPAHLDWYVRFATNRLVVAYGPRSRHSDSISGENWWRVLARSDVSVGRADPNIAPAGKRALLLLRRAESYYRRPGLSQQLLARASTKYMRPNATELAALLETGEVDYILDYESVARQYNFKFVSLPSDLAEAVLYGVSVPRRAENFRGGLALTAFLLSDAGKRILRGASVDVLGVPVAVGSAVPPEVSSVVRIVSTIR